MWLALHILLLWRVVNLKHINKTSSKRQNMADLSDFFSKLKHQIDAKSYFNANSQSCVMWQGATTSNGLYGRKKVKFPDGNTKLMRVSRVIYMIKHKSLTIPTENDAGQSLEMSHLCHHTLCVSPDHLLLEPQSTNNERKHCYNQNICTKSHLPHCIL